MDAVIAKARTRLLALKARHGAGKLDASAYENQRRAIEREIGDHLLAEPAEPTARPSLALVGSVVVAVLAIAALGYWKTGSPSLAHVNPAPDTVQRVATSPERSASDTSGLQQIAAMVETLAARMKERPDDAQGWTMLARSYTVLGRFDDALPAYKRATELLPKNAALLSDYADAVAATRGGANNPESNALVERALAIDPRQPKALALAGTAAYDRGDYSLAVERWTTMQAQLPPESELGKQVQASIDDARAHLGPGAAAPTPMARANSAATDAGAGTTAAGGAKGVTGTSAVGSNAAGASVTGTVVLDPALASQVARDDTVFVYARATAGGRMPLAVQRAKVADLPLKFKLDDSMAMAPGMTLSSAPQVTISARVSKSGNAIPQPGDFAGQAAPVAPGATGLTIRIDSVVNPR